MKRKLTEQEKKEIMDFYYEFRLNPVLNKLFSTPQHRSSNTFRHVCMVAKRCVVYGIKHNKNYDYHSLIRGAFLHDLFFYNWRNAKLKNLNHLWTHPRYALQNAEKFFTLTDTEKDIILHHMFPITLTKIPKTKEGLLVSWMDKKVTMVEFFSPKKSFIIFDLDGTLVDTLPDLHNALNYALKEHKLPEVTLEHTRKSIGNGIKLLIHRSVPLNTGDDLYNNVLKTFKSYYMEHCTDLSKPYDGMFEVLRTLKIYGYRFAVTANKQEELAKKLVDKYYPGLFNTVVGYKENVSTKPDPCMMKIACKRLKIRNPTKVLYVGDTEVDYQFAENSHIKCLLVDYGYRSNGELREKVGTTTIVNTPSDVYSYIKK